MRAPNTEPFRVGFLNVDSYSHMPLWAPHINPRPGEKDTPFTGMRITHVGILNTRRRKRLLNLTVAKSSRILTICWGR